MFFLDCDVQGCPLVLVRGNDREQQPRIGHPGQVPDRARQWYQCL